VPEQSSSDHEVMIGVVIVVLIGEVLMELLERVGVEGKKYKSPPAGPSIPIMVGEEGVRRPVFFCSDSGERVPGI
jgi:hypothetical protein